MHCDFDKARQEEYTIIIIDYINGIYNYGLAVDVIRSFLYIYLTEY